jgi:predicted flap endonuclease-1-like 5' DNA nuclease
MHKEVETKIQPEPKVQIEVKPPTEEKAPPKTKAQPKPDIKLSDIKGVGKKTEEKLRDAGYKSLKSIARARTKTLSEKTGLSEKVASNIIDAAKELLK